MASESVDFLRKLYFLEDFFDLPLPCWLEGCDGEDDMALRNAEKRLWDSRGDWWKDEKALGEVVPVGKKPKVGEVGL